MARGGGRLALMARRGSGGFVPRRASRAATGALLLVLAVFLTAGLCFAGPAAAKSYVIDDVRIVAAVKANGDLLVGNSAPSRSTAPTTTSTGTSPPREAGASRCSGWTGRNGRLRGAQYGVG